MSCPACDAAMSGCSGKYRQGCAGCTARSIARSLAAFNALHERGSGRNRDLVEMVDRMMPNVPTEQARQAVRDWWARDHQEQGALL